MTDPAVDELIIPTQSGHRIGKNDCLETVIRGFSWHDHRLTAVALIRAFQHWAVLGEFAP